jgi:hypothetical protein
MSDQPCSCIPMRQTFVQHLFNRGQHATLIELPIKASKVLAGPHASSVGLVWSIFGHRPRGRVFRTVAFDVRGKMHAATANLSPASCATGDGSIVWQPPCTSVSEASHENHQISYNYRHSVGALFHIRGTCRRGNCSRQCASTSASRRCSHSHGPSAWTRIRLGARLLGLGRW